MSQPSDTTPGPEGLPECDDELEEFPLEWDEPADNHKSESERLNITKDVEKPHEPTGPFGANSIAKLPTSRVAPTLGNAISDAVGVRITESSITEEDITVKLEKSGV